MMHLAMRPASFGGLMLRWARGIQSLSHGMQLWHLTVEAPAASEGWQLRTTVKMGGASGAVANSRVSVRTATPTPVLRDNTSCIF